MRVLYDHAAFCKERRGGISKYFSELVASVGNFGCEPSLPFLFVTSEHYVNAGLGRKLLFPNVRGQYRMSEALNRFMLRRASRADIWHSTYYNDGLLHIGNSMPMIATVHDMIPELFSNLYEYNPHRNKRIYVDEARHVIAVSQSTKHDMIEHYGISPDKISVIHHGINLEDAAKLPMVLPDRFILFVGRRGGYKNFDNLLKAWKQIEAQQPDLHLVCIGASTFSPSELLTLSELELRNVRYLSASDAQLRFAFRKALMFVFPSWYEGFGMPLLEAMANDCPMAISNTSCFPEIARDAAVYFDPTSASHIALQILSSIGNAPLLQSLIDRGRSLVKEYSLEKMSRKTTELYRQVAE